MKRKGLCLFLSMIMVLSMSCIVFATDNNSKNVKTEAQLINSIDIKDEITRAESGITDIPITDNMRDSVKAYLTDSNGNQIPVDVKITVRKLGSTQVQNSRGLTKTSGELYSMTAVASKKYNDMNLNSDGTAYAFGTVIWEDHLLIAPNRLKGINGGWAASNKAIEKKVKINFSDRAVEYGTYSNGGNTFRFYPTKDSFSKTNLDIPAMYKLGMHTTVLVNKSEWLNLSLIPGNLD